MNDPSYSGNCVLINDLFDGKWKVDSCTNKYAYACQKVPGECADGWIPFKNKCYLFNTFKQQFTAFYDAAQICSNYGGGLLTIDKLVKYML